MTKRILITGKDSYIGTSLDTWLNIQEESYLIDTLDMIDELWEDYDFSKYDVVFHVAGIAHIKETKKNRELYFNVNRDLAHQTAIKSKNDGVKLFIFISSMSVYGLSTGIIDKQTPLKPSSAYGKSKMEAEVLINALANKSFKVAVLRPPMVYGKKSKGNYQKLASLSVKMPIFPQFNNKRSMIYIDNLCEFIRQIIIHDESGLFFPQNKNYVNTSELVKVISKTHNKNLITTSFFNPLINKLMKFENIYKVFGTLIYDKNLSRFKDYDYNVLNFEESIKSTEV